MPNTQRPENRKSHNFDSDEDDTLREVGEDKEFELDDDEVDAAERRRDPLRQPY
jgi:hypothetical protein